MIVKSISLFGRELFRVERNRSGDFSYSFLDGSNYIDNGKYLDLYLTNPVLSTVVNFAANYYAQMKITHLDSNGKTIENSPYVNLLNNPNYFQSKQDFFYQQSVFLDVSGTNLIYQPKTFRNDLTPVAIYNLIPTEIDFQKIEKLNRFVLSKKDKQAIEEKTIKYTLDQTEYQIELKEMIATFDLSNGLTKNSLFTSPNRVKAVAKILNNINENINSKGLNLQMSQKYIGLNNNDGNKAQIQTDDRINIETAISKKNLLLTNAGIDVKHLVSDMKRLYLDEQYGSDFNKVLLAFGMNKNVINPFEKDSTFENQNQGLISYIQNTIQNRADNTMNSIAQSWGLFERGEKLKASYNHLPVMQSVINEKIKTLTDFQNMLKIAKENGTIDDSDAKQKTKDLIINLGL